VLSSTAPPSVLTINTVGLASAFGYALVQKIKFLIARSCLYQNIAEINK
jgi:hypothetical protein